MIAEKKGLLSLPRELLDYLASYMDNRSYCALACTSTHLYYVFTPLVWKKVALDLTGQRYVAGTFGQFPRCHTIDRSEVFIITLRDKWFFEAMQEMRLSSFVRNSMKELTIYFDAAYVPEVRRLYLLNMRFRSLEVLRLYVVRGPCEVLLKYFRPLALRAKKLDMHVNGFQMFHSLSNMYTGHIRSLLVEGNTVESYDSGLGPYVMNSWLERMVTLESLELRLKGDSPHVWSESLASKRWIWKETLQKLTKLKSLTIKARSAFSVFNPVYLPKTTENLSLSIYEKCDEDQVFPHVTCFVMELEVNQPDDLGLRFPNGLEHLEINGNVSNQQLRGLVEDSPNLLSLTGAFHTASSELNFVGTLCPRLKHIHLRDVRVWESNPIDPHARQPPAATMHQYYSNTTPDAMLATLLGFELGSEFFSDEDSEESDELKAFSNIDEEERMLVVPEAQPDLGYAVDSDQYVLRGNARVWTQNDPEALLQGEPNQNNTAQPEYSARSMLNNIAQMTQIETIVVYFPYDFRAYDYMKLIQAHPKLKAMYLLYRPDCILTKNRSGIFGFIKPFRYGTSPMVMVYEVDVAGYREISRKLRGEPLPADGVQGKPRGVILESKCMYCLGVGRLEKEIFV